MPTPIGHSLAGFAIHLASGSRPLRRRWLAAAALVALANLPDADFLPGYLIGQPRAYHWGPAHSLTAALLAAACSGFLGRVLTGRFAPFFLLGGTAYASHLLLDSLLGPGGHSVGLQLLWPLSTERFTSPWSVFLMLPGDLDRIGPVRALFSRNALPLIAREIAILAPVCLAGWLIGQRAARAPADLPRARPLAPPEPASCENS